MSKYSGTALMPVDKPILLRPGVMHRETDFHGNSKWYALPLEAKENARKGDLGFAVAPGFESKPLSHSGLPFRDLKKGR